MPYCGGKRRIAKAILDLFPKPDAYDRYCEPFFGGGAVYAQIISDYGLGWAAKHGRIIGEGDADLTDLYAAVREKWSDVYAQARSYAETMTREADPMQSYYALRKKWNETPQNTRGTHQGLHLYLRCTTYNGLWRRSKNGMNVPARDDFTGKLLPNEGTMADWAKALDGARIVTWNIEEGVAESEAKLSSGAGKAGKARGLFYFDPPYVEKFSQYLATGFNESAQRNTMRLARRLAKNGHHVYLSNSNVKRTRQLFKEEWPEAIISPLVARRSIAADKLARGDEVELIAYSTR